MCLIAFAHDVGDHVLVLAANRDEHHARPTAAAHAWAEAAHVFGGRDLEAGGTWLALSTRGRLAAVTNVRSWPPSRGRRSRGVLCADFLRDDVELEVYAERAARERASYGDFNLLLHDGRSMRYVSGSRGHATGGSHVTEASSLVAPGIHGLSNAALDVAWPKVTRATVALHAALRGPSTALVDALFVMLADRTRAADDELPETGVPREIEGDLSPIFIASPVYGTRSSTVVVWRRDGEAVFEERSFAPDGTQLGAVRRALRIGA